MDVTTPQSIGLPILRDCAPFRNQQCGCAVYSASYSSLEPRAKSREIGVFKGNNHKSKDLCHLSFNRIGLWETRFYVKCIRLFSACPIFSFPSVISRSCLLISLVLTHPNSPCASTEDEQNTSTSKFKSFSAFLDRYIFDQEIAR